MIYPITYNPFDAEPGWGVASVNFDLDALLNRASHPTQRYEI